MSNAKRSRSTHVVPLDAGKKSYVPPSAPEPTPLIACLKVKVRLVDAQGDASTHWTEVANYPAECGLDAFFDLMHKAPDDSFMTEDGRYAFAFTDIVAIGRPKDPGGEFPVKAKPSPPGAPKLLYQRLRVRIGLGRGEVIDVANVPWTENGIAHFGRMIGKYHRNEFVTTDSGFMPTRGVRLEDLQMPGETPAPKQARIRLEDMLRPEDIPE